MVSPCTLETIEKVPGCRGQFWAFGLDTTAFCAFGLDTTVYHHPQSRGITGLLDMKRLLFALSLARRTGHSVNPQPFDWLYLPRSLLLTIAFSKRYFEGDPVAATCTAAPRRFICRGTLAQRGIGPGCVPTEVGEPAGRLRAAWRAHGR